MTDLGGAAPSPRLERVQLHLLKVPLVEPYRLAFGDLHAFDTLIVELTDAAGRHGFGEATVLTGYTDESIGTAWSLATSLAERLLAGDSRSARATIEPAVVDAPFAATAFGAALDALEGHPTLAAGAPVSVSLLALLQGRDRGEWAERIDQLVGEGYTTLKVKVGYGRSSDLDRVAQMQSLLGGRAQLRLDANQAYSAEEAIDFVRRVEPAGIELFEQPCAADDWDAHRSVVRQSRVPLMLDESIYGLADIDRAADEGLATYVKLKLMKCGGVSQLEAGLARIRARGMKPVLGNGVACDPNCWMEACVAARHIDNAGEMNGFLKPQLSLFEAPMPVRRGAISLPADWRPRLDRDALRRCAIDTRDLHRHGHAF